MRPDVICATCGHYGRVRYVFRGSWIILLVLCLLFVIPGLLYLLYILTGRYRLCRQCGSRDVIAPDSPRGREMIARYYPTGLPYPA